MAEDKPKYKCFDMRRTKIRLVIAALILNVFILATFLTSSPQVSPASTWMTGLYKAYWTVVPVTSKTDLEALHANASRLTKDECVACHGTMVASRLVLHQIHLSSDLLPGLSCHDCHQKVSLEKRSNTSVVRLVNVAFCEKCHSAFSGLQPNSPMKPSDFKADCTTCHSGQHAFRHAQPYLSQVIAPRECPGCHGGRVLPWTPDHTKDDWISKHGPVALQVGVQSCMKCHEFGLAFCNECHSKKPPSHEPRDTWLQIHPALAKADTRVCFTCHKPDSCAKCHVNHTAGWLQRHSAFVLKNGADTCLKCHSLTFCSACHTGAPPSGLSSAAPQFIPPGTAPATSPPATSAPPAAAPSTATTP